MNLIFLIGYIALWIFAFPVMAALHIIGLLVDISDKL